MPELAATLCWLRENSGAVAAVATVAGVFVAAVYAFFTWRLWQETKRQATITQDIFQASHRSYISIKPEWSVDSMRELLVRFVFRLENHGNLPATITGWKVVVTLHGITIKQEEKHGAQVGLCVFPNRTEKVGTIDVGNEGMDALMHRSGPIRIEATVYYNVFPDRSYVTRLAPKLVSPNQFETERYEIE